MQLSYAQRLEDYHLDLVFSGRTSGFYIDVGGGHPVADNVSFAFYLKGWRGIVIEPQRALADLYAHVRPRDLTICSLVGRSDGKADFHAVDRLHGLSTMVESHARSAAGFGASYATERLPVRTLASITREHSVTAVDFLKIDVEGAEADVIAGADLTACRPRVVVVEAVAPGSMAEAWHTWEPALLASGYKFAFFDGLNRFYVADEAAELAARFPDQPASWESVQHLWDFGKAPERSDHPDHALAKRLVEGFLAALPSLERKLLVELLLPAGKDNGALNAATVAEAQLLLFGTAEASAASANDGQATNLNQLYAALMNNDRFRAALGRIASAYDGGQIME
jgi:FkbM family methyltransferase